MQTRPTWSIFTANEGRKRSVRLHHLSTKWHLAANSRKETFRKGRHTIAQQQLKPLRKTGEAVHKEGVVLGRCFNHSWCSTTRMARKMNYQTRAAKSRLSTVRTSAANPKTPTREVRTWAPTFNVVRLKLRHKRMGKALLLLAAMRIRWREIRKTALAQAIVASRKARP